MKPLINPTTVNHKIGSCPCCRDYLWAEVTVAAEVGDPTFTTEGKASVYATAKVVAATIPEHSCSTRDDF